MNNRIGDGTAPAPIVAVTMRAAWSDAARKLLARDEIMRRVLHAPDGASIRQIEAIVRTSPPSQRIFGDPRVEVAQRRLRMLDAEVRQVGDELVMRWSTKGADASGDVECISSAHLLERFDVEVAHDDEIQWSRWRDGQRTAGPVSLRNGVTICQVLVRSWDRSTGFGVHVIDAADANADADDQRPRAHVVHAPGLDLTDLRELAEIFERQEVEARVSSLEGRRRRGRSGGR